MEKLIYKVLTGPQMEEFQEKRLLIGAPIDVQDGFIHFSTAGQLPETLSKHFSGQQPLWILEVSVDEQTSKLKWEESRGGNLFPHLYRSLELTEVQKSEEIYCLDDGTHRLPDWCGA